MNRIFYRILIIMLFFSCQDKAKETNCVRIAEMGDIDLCLPKIDGQTECFTDPKIQAGLRSLNDPMNTIIAYYIDTDDHKILEETGSIPQDNFFKIYTPYMSSTRKMNSSEMKDILFLMTSGFDDISDRATISDSFIEETIQNLDQPVIIEKYESNNNSSTVVALMNMSIDAVETPMAVSINVILVQGRVLFVSHYLSINDASSVSVVKSNSNLFIKTFLGVN